MSRDPAMPHQAQQGFSLVELVIVIALTGIVAAVAGVLITGSIGGYADQTRRAELVDTADRALRRMAREIRPALPNSVRNCGGGEFCVEFLPTVAAARYRAAPGPAPIGGDPNRRLRFNQSDDQFNSTGPVGLDDGSYNDLFISIYNTGQTGNTAWDGDNMTQGFSLSDDVGGETRVTLNSPFQFPLESPRQRFFVVDAPVAFACEQGDELRRYTAYAPGDAYSNGDFSVLADKVENCRFEYLPGTLTRAGLLSMELVLEEEGERIRLFHQVHVDNAP